MCPVSSIQTGCPASAGCPGGAGMTPKCPSPSGVVHWPIAGRIRSGSADSSTVAMTCDRGRTESSVPAAQWRRCRGSAPQVMADAATVTFLIAASGGLVRFIRPPLVVGLPGFAWPVFRPRIRGWPWHGACERSPRCRQPPSAVPPLTSARALTTAADRSRLPACPASCQAARAPLQPAAGPGCGPAWAGPGSRSGASGRVSQVLTR
jgi:hypothetical protein